MRRRLNQATRRARSQRRREQEWRQRTRSRHELSGRIEPVPQPLKREAAMMRVEGAAYERERVAAHQVITQRASTMRGLAWREQDVLPHSRLLGAARMLVDTGAARGMAHGCYLARRMMEGGQ